jgi:quercetin dioxygenase-like cupin family protein
LLITVRCSNDYPLAVTEEHTLTEQNLIKNIPFSEPHVLADLVDYSQGKVVSRTLAQTESISLTLFAFDEGEGLSTHSASGDALVQVLDGVVLLTIGGKEVVAKAGEVVVMPVDIPHSVQATKRFKMLLTLIRKGKV